VDGELAAGSLCFYGGGEVFYWSGAMHERFSKSRPNNLLQWLVMEDAETRGFSEYNMGASGELGGVRRFKQQFGARPQSYPAYLVRGPLWRAGRALSRLVRRR
jgi:lipid II:glycine glycyltransferase (peptidoglycan interpeptide bridge formation enzyme)